MDQGHPPKALLRACTCAPLLTPLVAACVAAPHAARGGLCAAPDAAYGDQRAFLTPRHPGRLALSI